MISLTLPEWSTKAVERVPPVTAAALEATGAVRVSVDLQGRTVLSSSSFVGAVRVGDVQLRITPKLGVRRLLWLIGHAQNPSGWRDEGAVDLAESPELETALAVSFLAAANRALAQGIMQGYRVREEARPVLRGRIREVDQLRRRLGSAALLEVRFDDYTIDIPENQILVAAAERLARLPGIPAATRAGLRRLLVMLADVTRLPRGHQFPATSVNRLTRRYQPTLRLARLALAGHSFDQPAGAVSASGFLFNLNTVYEDWLTAAVRTALAPRGGALRAQYAVHLDQAGRIPMRPDMVWERDERPAAVLDAKYKSLSTKGQPDTDLYQMLAYCTALALPTGHLVYAEGTATRSSHVVRASGVTINVWSLDLSSPVPDLLGSVDSIAQALEHESA
ncbi:McrC family protein [Modestobacter sp. VKM Ac-2984]|uniref:McrC family protein n=1 Tax=Modestobacter sp. VKM Ac-2984 TaxID=3004138 RepID=UPI0022AA99E5|nr:hypothetical protein [Modestobacter sp. VKM Ac-2984]MCZ2817910.1 hypothetical protein [Modestobacter sp. VKM Ac-2984]